MAQSTHPIRVLKETQNSRYDLPNHQNQEVYHFVSSQTSYFDFSRKESQKR